MNLWDACVRYLAPHRDLVEPILRPDAVLLLADGSILTFPLSQISGVAFDNLTVHDPFSRQWHWQTTTGSRPTPRHEFCAVGV
jgi:hypothetical protein